MIVQKILPSSFSLYFFPLPQTNLCDSKSILLKKDVRAFPALSIASWRGTKCFDIYSPKCFPSSQTCGLCTWTCSLCAVCGKRLVPIPFPCLPPGNSSAEKDGSQFLAQILPRDCFSLFWVCPVNRLSSTLGVGKLLPVGHLPVSVNFIKTWPHLYVFIAYGCFHVITAGMSSCDRNLWPATLKVCLVLYKPCSTAAYLTWMALGLLPAPSLQDFYRCLQDYLFNAFIS